MAVCMTQKPIWINLNRNAFGVNDEENKMPRIVICDGRMPAHIRLIFDITNQFRY